MSQMHPKVNEQAFERLQEKIGVTFSNKDLLFQAFIHRSYMNETANKELAHNERLEFLGDAVLELVVTEYLYKTFPDPEGVLTNWRSSIVKGEVLAVVAGQLGYGDLLLLSRGEEKSGGRARNLILANTFEAVIGAIYLDKGYNEASKFIHTFLITLLPEIIEKRLFIDPKSHLQERIQESMSVTPSYKVIKEVGPDHDRTFTVAVAAGTKEIAIGTGSSKQRAEQNAAAEALKKLS